MILSAIEWGAGPTLVMLHGLFGQAMNFGTVGKRLGARFRVVALDLRNHGSSPHASGMRYPTMAADVLETLRARDLLPCVLLGHSMGGKVAMTLARETPDAVSRLIVADVAPVPYPPHFRTYAAEMAELPAVPDLTRARADTILQPAVPDSAMRAFLLRNLSFGPPPEWKIGLSEIIDGLPDIESWPASDALYAGPTLFIAGGRSDYILPEYREAIRRQFPAARFVTMRQAGHWLHADDPDGFVATVTSFAG